MKSGFLKILTIFLLVAVLMGGLVFVKKAEASGMPVVDAGHIGTTIIQTIKEGAIWFEEQFGVRLRDVIAKRIIDMIVDQTVEWIQGGGEPKFVTDWNGF